MEKKGKKRTMSKVLKRMNKTNKKERKIFKGYMTERKKNKESQKF